MSIIVHLFLFLLVKAPAFGHTPEAKTPGPALRGVYNEILSLQINKGRNTLVRLSPEDKNHAVFHYLENLSEVIEILLNENQTLYEKYKEREKGRIRKLEQLPADDPYKLFAISEIKIQWAFIKLKFGDSFSAGWNIKQAYKYAQENHRKFPDFVPNYKTRGILNILIGAVPQKYQWLLNMFGLKGTVSEGLELLSRIEQQNNIFSLEASILKCLSGVYVLQEINLVETFSNVYSAYPGNLLVKFAYAAVNFKSHQSEKALEIINESEKMNRHYARIHYFDYLKGKILLQKQSYTLAAYYFDRFIGRYQGRNNVKDAWFQLFLCYWLSDRREAAGRIYGLARVKGKAISAGDKYAERLLANNVFPHVQIMKVRLATDGGYYDVAWQQINKLSVNRLKTSKDKTELVYRMGRLQHLRGSLPEATEQYMATIKMTGKEPWYFAPSAALQLGHIYTLQRKYSLASRYFNLVLTFRNHPYRQSLDRQARSALNRLENLARAPAK